MVRRRTSALVALALVVAPCAIAGPVQVASGAVLSLERSAVMRISGSQWFGWSVASAGDVNGDGVADVLIGAPDFRDRGAGPGAAFVVFGRRDRSPARIDTQNLTPAQGYAVRGARPGDRTGTSVASLGDLSGDGVPELLVGAPGADAAGRNSGSAYVVFGQREPRSASLSAASLPADQGFRIDGPAADGGFGASVAPAGDVNGDGRPDMLVGADGFNASATAVVFGARGLTSPLRTSALLPEHGYLIRGDGHSVESAGDVNGDAVPDHILSGRENDVTVVFGQRSAQPATVNLAKLTPEQGYGIPGARIGGEMWSDTEAHAAGDVNGDGVPDLLTFAGGDIYDAGAGAYVIYGQRHPTSAVLNLGGDAEDFQIPTRSQGYGIVDPPGRMSEANRSGHTSLAAPGDIDGDGVPDVLVAAGSSLWAVYGRRPATSTLTDLARLPLTAGYRYDAPGDLSLAPIGDFDGDQVPDVIAGSAGRGEVSVIGLRASAPRWPAVTLRLRPSAAPGSCVRPTARAVGAVNAPTGARVVTRLRLAERLLRQTTSRRLAVRLPRAALRRGSHVLTLTATAADGTRAATSLRYRACR